MTIFTDRVSRFFEDEGSIADLREAIRLLHRSGVYDILRWYGIPIVIDQGKEPAVMAGQAHYAAGYQDALDHIQYFEELFGKRVRIESLDPPDFGGTKEALRAGHLRPSDLRNRI